MPLACTQKRGERSENEWKQINLILQLQIFVISVLVALLLLLIFITEQTSWISAQNFSIKIFSTPLDIFRASSKHKKSFFSSISWFTTISTLIVNDAGNSQQWMLNDRKRIRKAMKILSNKKMLREEKFFFRYEKNFLVFRLCLRFFSFALLFKKKYLTKAFVKLI